MSSTLRDPRCRRTICARRYPRALFSIPIKLRHLVTGGVQTSRGITLDISEGGLGALVQGDLRPGETVELDLSLPEQALSAVAIVRHSSQVRSGFEFLGLTAEERGRLTAFCARPNKPCDDHTSETSSGNPLHPAVRRIPSRAS
jgi:c-di-GMP-binding flagellar brake protein YcgR